MPRRRRSRLNGFPSARSFARLASCTNASAILSCTNGCYGITDCNMSATCVSGCPKCITKSGAVIDGGTGDGGTVVATTDAGSAECTKFCSIYALCFPSDLGTANCVAACEQSLTAECQSGAPNSACLIGCGSSPTCSAFTSCADACPTTC